MDRGRTRRGLMRAVGGGFTVALASRASVASAVAQDGIPCPATTAEEAEAVAEAYFAAFNAGDADALGAAGSRLSPSRGARHGAGPGASYGAAAHQPSGISRWQVRAS